MKRRVNLFRNLICQEWELERFARQEIDLRIHQAGDGNESDT